MTNTWPKAGRPAGGFLRHRESGLETAFRPKRLPVSGTADATAGTTAADLADQPGWVSSAVSSPVTLPQASRQPARHQSGLLRQFRGHGCVQPLVRRNRSNSAPEMNSAESNSDEETNQANNLKAIAQTLESATPEEDSRDRQQKHANASNQH